MGFATRNSLVNNTTIMHRHVDVNGNNVCEHIHNEKKQVVNRIVLLEQVPHPRLGLSVIYPKRHPIDGTTENIKLKEIDIKDNITNQFEFKVDYTTGRIHTHQSMEGLYLNIGYWGMGYNLIHSSRIFTQLDEHGNVVQTLEELIEMLRLVCDADYIIDVIKDLEISRYSTLKDIDYKTLNERLVSIEETVKGYLSDHLKMGKEFNGIKDDMAKTKAIADDVFNRMEVLEGNYLNPKVISNTQIDEILGKLV